MAYGESRRQKRSRFAERTRLALLEDDMDRLEAQQQQDHERLDTLWLWKAKVSVLATIGAALGGIVAEIIGRHL